ncbi:ATPase family protein associated with various cellular activities (AAA) [Kribbella sp. VKM Ac-2571]|uniref:AAA family ATPase n=1 Tax=Kribbella sp. VKM Ac-2571 TaxID=2512222 RepID=UPI0010620393|nr:AAA family ATPase [Kribbella sp. VKM Ac-2571]TDO55342.1 ATPase family protein associated with various cellular activities (AAA) [Kribbella sp. VKM Ac-2571]
MADEVRSPRVLDVLAAEEPWEVPGAWLARIRAQLKAWADDPEALRPLRPEAFPDFVKGTPAAVWYTHQVAPLLTGWIPVLHGEYADLSTELTHEFYRPSSRLGGSGHVIYAAQTDWHLQAIAGARGFRENGRRHALQLSRNVVAMFVDAPPMAARATALTAAFDRVLADRELTELHVAGEYDDIAKYWRTEALKDSERAVLPELAGPTAALRYSLNSVRDTHARMLMLSPDEYAGDFAQVLAELILATGLRGIPKSVAGVLGNSAVDVHKALQEIDPTFSLQTWHGHVNQWMSRAIRNGQAPLARSWGAAAARVGVHLAGVLNRAPWPEPEVPDLTTLFRMLDRERWSALENQAAANQEASLSAAWKDVKKDEQNRAGDGGTLDDPLPKPVDYSDNPLAELDSLIGLESVKDAVRKMVAEVKTNLRRAELGLPSHERARHMVFVGKPGTAKTTIARLLSRIYHQLGVLEKGHVVEVDRSDLVGAGVGSTAPMTAAKFREALGGVLFIDEAYSLTPENTPGDYGLEAVATILKLMEDHRNDCIVIVAGYHREMQRFMESNTGLQSRFPKLLSFSEYDTDQLVAIFELQARQKGMIYGEEVLDKVRAVIPPAPRGHSFGNGRFIRNVLEEAVSNQATRLSASDPDKLTERDLRELIPSDVRPPTSMRAEDYLLQKPGT